MGSAALHETCQANCQSEECQHDTTLHLQGYPFAFKQCGLVLTSLLLLLCFAACQLSMQLLLASSQLAGELCT